MELFKCSPFARIVYTMRKWILGWMGEIVCGTHQRLSCGEAIFKTSDIWRRRATQTITLVISNKTSRLFLSTFVGVNFQVYRIWFLYHFAIVRLFCAHSVESME